MRWTGSIGSINLEVPSSPSSSCAPSSKTAPWVVFSHGSYGEMQNFFSPSRGRLFLKSIPHMRHATCHGCSHGWMFMTTKSCKRCFLLNPVTMEKIRLPPLPDHLRSLRTALLTAPPDDRCSTVVCVDDNSSSCSITYCNVSELADRVWWRTEYNLDGNDVIRDVVTCRDGIYGITRGGGLVTVDFGRRPMVMRLQMPPVDRLHFGMARKERLVESCGELYRVQEIYFKATMSIHTFEVFKMDSGEIKWERVSNLGDRAFFLSDIGPCMSCSASDQFNVSWNSIYFVPPEEQMMYKFDFTDKSISIELLLDNTSEPWKHVGWVKPMVV